MPLRAPVALLLAVLLCVSATAAETRAIEVPSAGFSIDVPADWTIVQYSPKVLELKNGPSIIWIEHFETLDERMPTRDWEKTPNGGALCSARIGRDGVSVLGIEARVPPAQDQVIVDAILDSIDTTPYLYPTRHVDWNDGWTVTLPEGWSHAREIQAAHFRAADRSSSLLVERLADVMKAAGGEQEAPEDLDAWADFAWREGLKRIQDAEGLKAEDEPTIETVEVGDTEGRRMHLGLDPDDEGRPRGWMHVFVLGGYRVLAQTRGTSDEVDESIRKAVSSFRLGMHPGPRVGTAEPTDRFPGDKGPAVVFALPTGWTLTPGTNSMRLAQIALPDVEGVETVVFFFGVGGGGAVDNNIERWRGQMQGGDEGTVETFEPVEGVKITLLDVAGAYASSRMNPHGRDPHGGDDDGQGGSRMLGAVVEVPGGPLFVKVIGPDTVVKGLRKDLTTWLLSFRPAS